MCKIFIETRTVTTLVEYWRNMHHYNDESFLLAELYPVRILFLVSLQLISQAVLTTYISRILSFYLVCPIPHRRLSSTTNQIAYQVLHNTRDVGQQVFAFRWITARLISRCREKYVCGKIIILHNSVRNVSFLNFYGAISRSISRGNKF